MMATFSISIEIIDTENLIFEIDNFINIIWEFFLFSPLFLHVRYVLKSHFCFTCLLLVIVFQRIIICKNFLSFSGSSGSGVSLGFILAHYVKLLKPLVNTSPVKLVWSTDDQHRKWKMTQSEMPYHIIACDK